MAQQYINIGSAPNDGTGDVMRVCFTKADNNFSELYYTTANLTSNLSNLSTALNVFEGYVYTQLGVVSNTANAAYLQSNNANAVAQAAFQLANTANQAWIAANAALAYATLVAGGTNQTLNLAFQTANAAFGSVNAVGIYANTINTGLNGINGVASNAVGAFNQANLSGIYAAASFNEANAALTIASAATTSVNNLGATSNNISSTLGTAFGVANAAFGAANNDLTLTNFVYYLTNAAFGKANSGYTLAAAAIPAYNGTATGTLSVANFSTSGSATFASYHTIDGNGAVFRTGNNNYGVRIYAGGYGTDTTKTQIQFYSSDQSTQYGYIGANSSLFWVGSVANLPTNIMVNNSLIGNFTTSGLSVTGQIWATDNITAYNTSDIKLKDNIKNLTNPLNKIKQINGVEYDWKDDYINDLGGEDGYFIRKHDVGVIAQEIEKVLPEVVAERKDGTKAVRYEKIIPLLIEAIKELSDEVERLKNGISK
jgi:hypothetical protein